MRYEPIPLTIYATKNIKIEKKSTITHKIRIFTWFNQDVYIHEEIHFSLYEKNERCTKIFCSSFHPKTQSINSLFLTMWKNPFLTFSQNLDSILKKYMFNIGKLT